MSQKKKFYRCKGCKRISTILTIGDLYIGCASCGGLDGYEKRLGVRGKWTDYYASYETEKIHKFLITEKI